MTILGEDGNAEALNDHLNLWIVRHSAVDADGALYGGGLDLDTHDLGKYSLDFEWLSSRLNPLYEHNTIFYTSEQKRSIQTFNELMRHYTPRARTLRSYKNADARIQYDSVALRELNEQNFGVLEGYNFEYLCGLVNGGWQDLYEIVKENRVHELHDHLKSSKCPDHIREAAAKVPGFYALQDAIHSNDAPVCEDLAAFHKSCLYFYHNLRSSCKFWQREREHAVNNIVLVSHRCRIRGLLAAATQGAEDLDTFASALKVYENIAIENLSLTRLVILDGQIDRPARIHIPEINSRRNT